MDEWIDGWMDGQMDRWMVGYSVLGMKCVWAMSPSVEKTT